MTYDQIIAAVHDYVHRTDSETVANEARAVEFARLVLQRDFHPQEAWRFATLTLVDGRADLPADLAGLDAVTVEGFGELNFVGTREWATRVAERSTKGYHTVAGLELVCAGDVAAASVAYWARVEAISGTQTNYLSELYPDVWTWAGVAEQRRFVKDYEGAGAADATWQEIAGRAMAASRKGAASGGGIRIKGR
jgi:hypothetical protein